jgi:hydrogenase nickel incorporation protein HypA/HybF
MHEASIVTALLARVEAEAASREAGRVHRVELVLGELSGVEPELLLRAWEVFRTGTRCDGAELAIAAEAARWECPRCGGELPRGGFLACPACAAPARLAAGGEITLQRLELEVIDEISPRPEVRHV